MKTIIASTLFAFLILSTSSFVWQQNNNDFEWAHHNIIFTLADDFKEVTNSEDEFTAEGDGMEFGIYPFTDGDLDRDDMTAYTIAIANAQHMTEIDDVDIIDMNGLEGGYVEGFKDGDRMILLGFIDPDSDTNFFAYITFGDDDKEAEQEAIKMITSLRKK